MIKKIYCFGTSYSTGGGYEFTSKGKWNKIPNVYNDISNVNINQKFFSWPGQLNSLSEKFTVINYSKSGGGQETLWRRAYELIESLTDNELNESLFLFEYSFTGKREIYLNELKDYILFNYRYEAENHEKIEQLFPNNNLHDEILEELKNNIIVDGYAKEYYFDDKSVTKIIENNKNTFIKYFNSTVNLNVEGEYINRNNKMFESYLKQQSINYVILTDDKNNLMWNTPYKKSPFLEDVHEETITYETDGFVKDGHKNLRTNKYISEVIFNMMITEGYINENIINTKYPYL